MTPLGWLEEDMARHMLIEFPLLIGAGALLAARLPVRVRGLIERADLYGLTSWTFFSLTVAYWMIPAALDAAIANAAVNAMKYASFVGAGVALREALRHSLLVVEAFFVGNLAWMGATVGLLYAEAGSQLCLSYLVASQQGAGNGLVMASVMLIVAWAAMRRRALTATVACRQGA